MTHPPGPKKRPTQEPPAGYIMARFVMAEDAKAGMVVDLDLNTGKLVPARMAPLGGSNPAVSHVAVPADPPPGLMLRALVANWRDLVAQPAPDTTAAAAARGALSSVADQLERTLDMMGVAAAMHAAPARPHVPYGEPGGDLVICTRCGKPLILVQGTPPLWLDDREGLAECDG